MTWYLVHENGRLHHIVHVHVLLCHSLSTHPTYFDSHSPSHPLLSSLSTPSNIDEVIHRVNTTEYGLVSGVFTNTSTTPSESGTLCVLCTVHMYDMHMWEQGLSATVYLYVDNQVICTGHKSWKVSEINNYLSEDTPIPGLFSCPRVTRSVGTACHAHASQTTGLSSPQKLPDA